MISIDDFAKIEVKVGLVTEATNKEGSEKLIRLVVDVGHETRVIFTAVRPFGYTPEFFQGKKFLFLTNLEYKKIMDEESQGMILAVDGEEGAPVFVVPEKDTAVGSRLR